MKWTSKLSPAIVPYRYQEDGSPHRHELGVRSWAVASSLKWGRRCCTWFQKHPCRRNSVIVSNSPTKRARTRALIVSEWLLAGLGSPVSRWNPNQSFLYMYRNLKSVQDLMKCLVYCCKAFCYILASVLNWSFFCDIAINSYFSNGNCSVNNDMNHNFTSLNLSGILRLSPSYSTNYNPIHAHVSLYCQFSQLKSCPNLFWVLHILFDEIIPEVNTARCKASHKP